jgi:hypothetical protein
MSRVPSPRIIPPNPRPLSVVRCGRGAAVLTAEEVRRMQHVDSPPTESMDPGSSHSSLNQNGITSSMRSCGAASSMGRRCLSRGRPKGELREPTLLRATQCQRSKWTERGVKATRTAARLVRDTGKVCWLSSTGHLFFPSLSLLRSFFRGTRTVQTLVCSRGFALCSEPLAYLDCWCVLCLTDALCSCAPLPSVLCLLRPTWFPLRSSFLFRPSPCSTAAPVTLPLRRHEQTALRPTHVAPTASAPSRRDRCRR